MVDEEHRSGNGNRFAFDRRHGIPGITDDADIDRGIVHVVLNALAVHPLQPKGRAASQLDVRTQVDAPPRRVAGKVELIGEQVVPAHSAQQPGNLDVTARAAIAVLAGEVGQRAAPLDVLQFDAVCEHTGIARCTRTLGRDRESRVPLNRHPAHLDVSEEHHARRAPVLEGVREHVGVHERAPGTGPRRSCRARHTHGAGGRSSGPRPRPSRTVRTRRWSGARPVPWA